MGDQYIDIDGTRVRFRDSGGENGAQPIFFIHGVGLSLEFWEAQETLIAAHWRFISIDLPGHGLSDLGNQPYEPSKFASFCWTFLDALGVDDVTLVGHSMGGGIAIRMAASRPDKVSKLCLACSATLGRDAPFPFRLMTLPLLGSIMTKPNAMAVKQQIKATFFEPEKSVSPRIREIINRNVMSAGRQKAFLDTLRLMTDLGGQKLSLVEESRRALKALTMPVLFLHGHDDTVVPPQHSFEGRNLVEGAELAFLDDCGHTPQVEQADEFNRHLSAFLGR